MLSGQYSDLESRLSSPRDIETRRSLVSIIHSVRSLFFTRMPGKQASNARHPCVQWKTPELEKLSHTRKGRRTKKRVKEEGEKTEREREKEKKKKIMLFH